MSTQNSCSPDKRDIKIFVSHTAGSDNDIIDNPLFVNVRGGAVFAKTAAPKLPGDDTGDNISELNRHFSEYSVIYWAWKNQQADYFGLCHYRRFLSFSDKKLPAGGLRQVNFDGMTKATLQAAGLDDPEKMRQVIEEYDMIVPYEHDVVKHDCKDTRIKNVRQFWLRYHASYLKESEFDLILQLIKKHNKAYYKDALEYMKRICFRGFNCFVMKKELFNEYCEYVFPMLFEFEKKCDRTHNSTLTNRNTGYAGEWFFSIFVYHKIKEGKCRIKETQLVVYSDTLKEELLKPAFVEKSIPIVFSVSDTNAHRVAATLQSIIDNRDPVTKLDIILLHPGNTPDRWHNQLLKEELSSLVRMQEKYGGVSIRSFNPKNEIGRLELRDLADVKHKEKYYGVLLPFILKDFERAVYISDTMLCRGDISGILEVIENGGIAAETDISSGKADHSDYGVYATYDLNYIAMVNGFVPGYKDKVTNRLGLHDPYAFFSADFIVYDLKKARESFRLETVAKKIITCSTPERQLTASEAINLVYQGKIGRLPQTYNAFYNLEPDYFAVCEYIPSELDKGTEDTKLINLRAMHQVTRNLKLDVIKEYLSYGRKTLFYEELLLDMGDTAILNKKKKYVKRVHYKQQSEEYIEVHKTYEQALADKMFPMGSPVRSVIDTVLPKGTKRQELVKKCLRNLTR